MSIIYTLFTCACLEYITVTLFSVALGYALSRRQVHVLGVGKRKVKPQKRFVLFAPFSLEAESIGKRRVSLKDDHECTIALLLGRGMIALLSLFGVPGAEANQSLAHESQLVQRGADNLGGEETV
jgi:hypothetical protein